jgi:hypothetical protein
VAILASAKSPLIKAFQGVGNLVQGSFLILQEAQGELLLKIIRTKIRHVDWHVGQVAARLPAGIP